MSSKATFVDHYEILGVDQSATLKEIARAYRSLSLKCHPDKNPSATAAETFRRILSSFEALSDKSTRESFDRQYSARLATQKRVSQMDKKRRLFKEELERKEKSYQDSTNSYSSNDVDIESEIKRLREEGNRILAQQRRNWEGGSVRKSEEPKKFIKSDIGCNDANRQAKVKWKCDCPGPCEITDSLLLNIFSKYGVVSNVICSFPTSYSSSSSSNLMKNRVAIIEYLKESSVQSCLLEFGASVKHQLTVQKIGKDKYSAKRTDDSYSKTFITETVDSKMNHDDFESMVLLKMQSAAKKISSSDCNGSSNLPQ